MGDPRAVREEDLPAVIRRSVELDVQRSAGGGTSLDLPALEQVGEELGLSREAIRQAVAEYRAGRLQPAEASSGRTLLGPATVGMQRSVPGPAEVVWRRVDSFLTRQWLERRRHSPDGGLWAPRTGFAAGLRRSFDFDGSLRLNDVGWLSVTVTPTDEAGTNQLVCFQAHLGHHRSRLAAGLIGTPLAGGAAAGAVGLVLGIPEVLLAAVPAGLGLSAGGWAVARNAYRRRQARVEETLAGLLDRLEHPH